MITLMSAIRRRPGMSRAEFVHYLRDVHGAIATKEPLQLSRYVQNHVTDSSAGAAEDEGYAVAPDRDNVTELVFADLAALGATMGAPYSRDVVGPDGVNFSDLSTAVAVLVDVIDKPVPSPGPGAVKVFVWLHAVDGISKAAFDDNLSAAHDTLDPTVLAPIRQLVHHHHLPAGDDLLRYFGGEGVHVHEGVLCLRFDDAQVALPATRAYTAALLAGAATPLVDPSRCFTLVADEVVIYDRAEGSR